MSEPASDHAAAANEPATRTGAQAVDRALGVLNTFLEGEELALSDIARRRGLTVSTAHRLLQALVRDRERLARMSKAARAMARPDAAARIADRVETLAQAGRSGAR